MFRCTCESVRVVSYTHLDVYKRQHTHTHTHTHTCTDTKTLQLKNWEIPKYSMIMIWTRVVKKNIITHKASTIWFQGLCFYSFNILYCWIFTTFMWCRKHCWCVGNVLVFLTCEITLKLKLNIYTIKHFKHLHQLKIVQENN